MITLTDARSARWWISPAPVAQRSMRAISWQRCASFSACALSCAAGPAWPLDILGSTVAAVTLDPSEPGGLDAVGGRLFQELHQRGITLIRERRARKLPPWSG